MTAPTDRRWYRGSMARCTCPGHGGVGRVTSQRPLGELPYLSIRGVEHDCATAVLVDRRSTRVVSARGLSRYAPRVELVAITRSWLRAIPASQRAAATAAALGEAARRGPVHRAVVALHDCVQVAVELGADLRDRDSICLRPPAVVDRDDDWIYQYERAFAAALDAWRREAHDDDIVAAAVAAALEAAAKP